MYNEVSTHSVGFREFQAPYAAFRTKQPLVTLSGMRCATSARLEAIVLERSRWGGVSRDAITAFGKLDALTAPAELRVPLSAGAWPVSATLCWSGACARMPC